jgi:hypothetical protein
MDVVLNLVTTEQEMMNEILTQYKIYIDNLLINGVDKISKAIQRQIRLLILGSPIVPALTSDLGMELGVTPEVMANVIEEIIDIVSANIEVTYQTLSVVNGKVVSGGYTIRILRSDFTDVLGIQDASYTTTNGIVIPWLNWLLYAGTSTVVYGYRIELDPHNTTTSRTGAIMVKDPAGRWSVPSEYAGTQSDNFLTRALMPLETELQDIVKTALGM